MHRSVLAPLITLALLSPVLAQTTAPTTTAPAGRTGFGSWWWVILIIVIAVAAIWYFMRNKRTGV
jgi:LPXTG-motif cell wall-anchored protein